MYIRDLHWNQLRAVCALLAVTAVVSPAQLPDTLSVTVPADGATKQLNLYRRSVRTSDFHLRSWSQAGGMVSITAPEVRSYRGTVTGDPNTIVCAVIWPDNKLSVRAFEGKIDVWSLDNYNLGGQLPSGSSVPSAATVVSVADDTGEHLHGEDCGCLFEEDKATVTKGLEADGGLPLGEFTPPVGMYQMELGYDATGKFYRDRGSSVERVVAYIDNLVNVYNYFMARDPMIDIVLTEVVVRTEDFYVPTSMGGHLNLLYNEWIGNAVLGTSRWDAVASFATSQGLFGAGGYAWGNNIGKDEKSVSVNALFHEQGHNWNASHYYYGRDTMGGNRPRHGPMNIQRVLKKRQTEIGEGNLVVAPTYPDPLHPYAQIDLASTLVDTAIDLDVLANDWDGNGDVVSIGTFTHTTVPGGTVQQVGNLLRYTPPAGYVGKDIIVYTTQDTTGLESTDLVHIEVVNRGLAAHWAFDETSGTTAADATGNGHDSALPGGLNFSSASAPGVDGQALRLPAGQVFVCDNRVVLSQPAGDYPLEELSSNFFDPMDESFSFAGWVRLGEISGTVPIAEKHNKADFGYAITASEGGFVFTVREWNGVGSSRTLPTATPLAPDTWYHVAMVIDRTSNQLKAWVNGTAVAQTVSLTSGSFVFEGRTDLTLGGGPETRLDDVRIYTKALSNADVQALVAGAELPASVPVPADGSVDVFRETSLSWQPGKAEYSHDVYLGFDRDAVANADTASPLYLGRMSPSIVADEMLYAGTRYFWRVDEVPASGVSIAGDVWSFTTASVPLRGGLALHLPLDEPAGATTAYDQSGSGKNVDLVNGAAAGQPGRIGLGVELDGTNDGLVSSSANLFSGLSGITVAGWFKTRDTDTSELFSIEGAYVLLCSNGALKPFFDGSSSGNPNLATGVNDGTWHHFVAFNTGTRTWLFLDGAVAGSTPETLRGLSDLDRGTAFGARYDGGSKHLDGTLDDLAIWTRVLTSDEIQSLYQAGHNGDPFYLPDPVLVDTSFEAVDGFTGFPSGSYADLGTVVDNQGVEWSSVTDASIWNRSDIPPDGVQALVLGLNRTTERCRIVIPGSLHGVRSVSFDYASFSSSTDADVFLLYDDHTGAGWVEAWTTHVSGNNPSWSSKPWPTVNVQLPIPGDVDLMLLKVGTKGVLIDKMRVVGWGADSDSDGLEDNWEWVQFGTLSQDGTADSDGDGLDDAGEFGAGTDPNDVLSRLAIEDVNLFTLGRLTLRWSSALDHTTPRRLYDVYCKDGTGEWIRVAGDLPPGGPLTTHQEDLPVEPSTAKMYRIEAVP